MTSSRTGREFSIRYGKLGCCLFLLVWHSENKFFLCAYFERRFADIGVVPQAFSFKRELPRINRELFLMYFYHYRSNNFPSVGDCIMMGLFPYTLFILYVAVLGQGGGYLRIDVDMH